MSRKNLSIFWYICQFLCSETWSSCHSDLSLAWLDLHQDILYCLWLLWRVLFSWFPSQSIYHLYEGGLLIWVNFISSFFGEWHYSIYKWAPKFYQGTPTLSYHPWIMISWYLLPPICIPLISFCCYIALAKTSSTILNRCGESGQPCPVLDLIGIALSFSQFNLMLTNSLL